MPRHLEAPNGAKRSYSHDLPHQPPYGAKVGFKQDLPPPLRHIAKSAIEGTISMDDMRAALTDILGPPPLAPSAAPQAPPAPLTKEQEDSIATRRMGAPKGETSLERKFQAKYERLAAVNEETAEKYAWQVMRQAAERIYGSKQNLTNGPDGNGKIIPLVRQKKVGRRVSRKGKARLARSLGKKELSRWEDCYVDTLGSICGVPVLLVESLGEGEGVLEFKVEVGEEGEEGREN